MTYSLVSVQGWPLNTGKKQRGETNIGLLQSESVNAAA